MEWIARSVGGRACSAWASLRELTFQQHPGTAGELIERTTDLVVIICQEDGREQATETRGLDCTCGETSSSEQSVSGTSCSEVEQLLFLEVFMA